MNKFNDESNVIFDSATYNNSYLEFNAHAYSIGFKTCNFNYKHSSNGVEAESFLMSSRTDKHNAQDAYSTLPYYTDIGKVTLSMNCHYNASKSLHDVVMLPDKMKIKKTLEQAIASRKSTNKFSGMALSLEELATLMNYADGVCASSDVVLNTDDKVQINFRTHPSAGGIYPIELYLVPLNVENLSGNLYLYDAMRHCLIKKCSNVTNATLDAFLAPEINDIKSASLIILFTGRPWKLMRKYGNKGLKFMYIESGAIAQNINLTISALGLVGFDCASFCDNDINRILGFDGVYNTYFHSIVVGKSK